MKFAGRKEVAEAVAIAGSRALVVRVVDAVFDRIEERRRKRAKKAGK